MKNINFINLTVQNSTYNGVSISGAANVNISRCDFTENGVSVPPGQKLLHNLLLAHCIGVTIKDSRLDTSPLGSGISLDHCSDVSITNCEIARNGYYGILIAESKNITIQNNFIEANDRSGIMIEFLHQGSENITVRNNVIHYNNGFGLESYAARKISVENNTYVGNGNQVKQEMVSDEKIILMQ